MMTLKPISAVGKSPKDLPIIQCAPRMTTNLPVDISSKSIRNYSLRGKNISSIFVFLKG
jgi:hypothetical protein